MSYTTDFSWPEANQRHLMQAIAEVRQEIEDSLDLQKDDLQKHDLPKSDRRQSNAKATPPGDSKGKEGEQLQPPSALDSLCSIFQLSSFERKILLMCAGVEMDSSLSELVARVHRDDRRRQPTFGLALGAFSDAHWS